MSVPTCKFFRSEQGCKFGNKCRYKHSDPQPFPAVQQSYHQGQHDYGSVRRFYSAETSSHSYDYPTTSGEYEASVRNQRSTDNFPLHSNPSRVASNHEDQVRFAQRSHTADTRLEEKFRNLRTADHDHDEGAVRLDFDPALPQRPQRKLCHYFARHGNCCFGSRCRFEHAQPGYGRPPRFQAASGGPRYETDRYRQSSGSLADNRKGGGEVRSRHPDGDLVPFKADPSGSGSAVAAFQSAEERAPNQPRGNQHAQPDPAQERSESRNAGRNQTGPNIKPDKVCQFFMRGWCVRGRRCKFLHPRRQAAAGKETDPEPEHEEQEEKKTPNTPEEQRKLEGSISTQSTSAQNPTKSTSEPSKPSRVQNTRTPYVAQGTKKYRRDEVDDVEGSRLRRTEIDQLIKRFPRNKVKVTRDCAEYFQCIIHFSPTDPDWPFDVKVFQLQVDIPLDYPFEMLTITVPDEQDLPETVRRYLEISIEEWLEDKERQLADNGQVELVFRPFLRWLDRNIEDVVTEGLKQLKRELVAKASGLEFISAKQLQKQYPGQSSSSRGDEDDNDSEEEDDDETESESQDEDTSSDYDESDEDNINNERAEEDGSSEKKGRKTQQDKTKAMMTDPERRGTEITLKNLQLKESAATLYFEKVCLLIQCERCKGTSEFMASPGRVNMIQCGQCSQTQTAVYRPAMAHFFSGVVGYLDLDACLPYDLILQKCSPVMACMSCSKDTKSGAVIAGQPQDQWCRVCHKKLRVATDGIRFTQLEPSKTPQSLNLKGSVKVVVPSRKRIPKDPAIQEGKPLPNFGTCKHYKKSYRWLRFPCCGKCYPCDVCHDSKEDHEMTFANRMICGFCCREQPYAAERPCKGCDMNMTRVHTKHWEGGQGCRDKISMSRNDKQKYRNVSKTTSKHSKKVKDMQSKKRTKLRHT